MCASVLSGLPCLVCHVLMNLVYVENFELVELVTKCGIENKIYNLANCVM